MVSDGTRSSEPNVSEESDAPGDSEWTREPTPAQSEDGTTDLLERLFRDTRTNAILAWAMVGVLTLTFLESLLDMDLLWMIFVAATGAIVLAPTVAHRNWRVMLPWELLVLALSPILVRGLFGGEVGIFATYLAIAALGLLVTVELHMFTSLKVTHWFALGLVVMATLAAAALWAMVRWTMDGVLGTSFLTTNEALMIEWIYVTLAGLAAGVIFDAYFKRRGRQLRRAIRRVVIRG